MIEKENFERLYDNFFSFTFELKKIRYRSVIFFDEACSDQYFADVFNSIKEMLLWLKQNVDNIKSDVKDKLPVNCDVDIFKDLYIISFSLFFEKKCDCPIVNFSIWKRRR